MIEKNVTESLNVVVLARSSSQPKSTYEEAASLSEFKLTKILIDKMEKNKSYDKADYKRELYDALVKSYQTDKDLFDTYGKVFTLKRSREDKDKDQDPSVRSDRGTKRRKSSKEAKSSRDSRSKEKKSSRTSKDASHSQHKPSGKSAHAEEPNHAVNDSRVQQDQEFDTGNNDEQPTDKEVSKDDWFKKPERPPTPNSDWNKRQHDTTERLNWHNPEGKLYPFDFSIPLPLIPDHRGHQVIPQDFFINNDLEYLKGRDLSRRDGTLNNVRTVLHDIAKGITMEYLPKRKWSGLDKRRARVTVQDIDKQLYERRLM
ncbi:hypothetical protein Tco_0749402 [Tanacetum coccineum]|uniref:Uncharacterized protein n=1 Tax=Tanacetum coccineum TaxID=301880 RepID=A0ABQ4Z0V8_9ASTR